MNIGIDAKWFHDGHPSGRRIAQNLVYTLNTIEYEHNVFIFFNKKFKNIQIPNKNNKLKYIYVWAGNNLLSNIFMLPYVSRKYKIDVLICNNFSPLFTKSKKITWILDVIFLSHPNYFTLKEKIYFSFIKPLSKGADHLCTISDSEKKRMLKYGLSKNESKISVIHLGIETKFKVKEKQEKDYIIKIKTKYKLPTNFLLYVGRLNERKNLGNLLKAYSILLRSKIELPLVLAGSVDWKMFDIQKYCIDLEIEKNVILTDFVDEVDLPGIYCLATLFCYVSYEEGFGLPLLESMASGVPVIVSNTSSLPEICGDAGFYCNPFDPDDISRKIKTLVDDKVLYNFKKQKGLERSGIFSWENTTKNLLHTAEKVFLDDKFQ